MAERIFKILIKSYGSDIIQSEQIHDINTYLMWVLQVNYTIFRHILTPSLKLLENLCFWWSTSSWELEGKLPSSLFLLWQLKMHFTHRSVPLSTSLEITVSILEIIYSYIHSTNCFILSRAPLIFTYQHLHSLQQRTL